MANAKSFSIQDYLLTFSRKFGMSTAFKFKNTKLKKQTITKRRKRKFNTFSLILETKFNYCFQITKHKQNEQKELTFFKDRQASERTFNLQDTKKSHALSNKALRSKYKKTIIHFKTSITSRKFSMDRKSLLLINSSSVKTIHKIRFYTSLISNLMKSRCSKWKRPSVKSVAQSETIPKTKVEKPRKVKRS